jgi:TIR domain
MLYQQHDVFISHNTKDEIYVNIIAEHLKDNELDIWIDREHLYGGDRIQKRLQEAIHNSKTIVVCIGNNGLGDYQSLELDTATELEVKERLRIIPILLPSVEKFPDEPAYLFLKRARYLTWKPGDMEALEELTDSIFQWIPLWGDKELKRLAGEKEDTEKKLREIDKKIQQVEIEIGVEANPLRREAIKWLASARKRKNIERCVKKALEKLPISDQLVIQENPNLCNFCTDLETFLEFIHFAFRSKNCEFLNHYSEIELSITSENLPLTTSTYHVHKKALEIVREYLSTSPMCREVRDELSSYFDYLENQILVLM